MQFSSGTSLQITKCYPCCETEYSTKKSSRAVRQKDRPGIDGHRKSYASVEMKID